MALFVCDTLPDMQLAVNRKWLTDTASVGRIIVNGVDSYFSMERAASDPARIPAGLYTISLHTPNAPILVATLKNLVAKYESMEEITQYPQLNSPAIAKRDPILFHPGNVPLNSDGCILVGNGVLADYSAIIESDLACSTLIPLIVAAVKSGEQVTCLVTDPQIVTDIDLE